jgi:hypothetical protein
VEPETWKPIIFFLFLREEGTRWTMESLFAYLAISKNINEVTMGKPIVVALAYGMQGEKANLVQLVYFNALDKAEKYVSSVTNEDKYTWTLAEIIDKGMPL